MADKRRYHMRRRAEQVKATRRRIVEAVVQLHTEVGVERTTVSAVAKRAGVQRLTVYKHYPDDVALFTACQSHWLAANPVPDLADWADLPDRAARLRCGLAAFYEYFDRTEDMIGNLLRDSEVSQLVADGLGPFFGYIDRVVDVLADGWPDRASTRAAITLAMSFHSWRTLVRSQGLSRDDAVNLMVELVRAANSASERSSVRC